MNMHDKHVNEILSRHGIGRKLVGNNPFEIHSVPIKRYVALREQIKSDAEYFIALHEIGHVMTDDGLNLPAEFHPGTIQSELAAWAWAFKNSVIEITADMLDIAAWGYQGYVQNAPRFGWKVPAHNELHEKLMKPLPENFSEIGEQMLA